MKKKLFERLIEDVKKLQVEVVTNDSKFAEISYVMSKFYSSNPTEEQQEIFAKECKKLQMEYDKNPKQVALREKKEAEFSAIISNIEQIDKEGLNERIFYHKLMGVLKGLRHMSLSETERTRLSNTLKSIGCKTEKLEATSLDMDDALREGSLIIAQNVVNACLSEEGTYTLSKFIEGDEQTSLVDAWLRGSRKFTNMEEAVLSRKEREKKEALKEVSGLKEQARQAEALDTQTQNALEQAIAKQTPIPEGPGE